MPATTAKQQRYMGMCAHNPKEGCPSKEVAEEFSHKPAGGYKGGKNTTKGHQSVHTSGKGKK